MAGKTLSFFNLTGGLNTVQTMATINSTTNRTESPDMVNVEYFKLSGLRTMNGNVALNGGNSINSKKIEFGYEYVKGNERYMIVADRQSLYMYQPTTDTFTTIFDFDLPADTDNYITICGYANGIVAACPNVQGNAYLLYYRKDRRQILGTVTTDGGAVLTYTGNYIMGMGTGDIVEIDGTEYEIQSVDTDNSKITLTTTPTSTFTGKNITLTDITKIPCKAEYDVEYSGVTITNFVPRIVHSHQGRLWVAAKPDNYDTTAVVIYSDLGSIHDAFKGGDQSVYDGGYFEEFWEDTSDITALGTWDKYVVVHKREHTYLINTSNSDATTWNVESYSEYTCDNQRGYVKANNGYYVYTTSGGGIYPMIQRTIYSAISQGAEASVKIRDTFANLNQYRLDEIFAVYHPIKKYIMFYMPMIGQDGSKDCYIYDLQTRSWLHRQVPQNVTTAFEFDNKVYIGTEDGKVYEEFRGYTFAGEPINFSWKSPWFIWGNGTNWTTTREIRVKMSQEGTNNFFIRNRRDGNEDYKQRTITNTSTATNNLFWDESVLAGDITSGYTGEVPVYSYNIDGTTYYSFDSVLHDYSIVFTFDHVPTQADINSMLQFSNGDIAATITERQSATQATADIIIAGTDPIYAYTWKGTIPTYKCYQSSQDPNVKIWVDANDTTKGIINIEQQLVGEWYSLTYPSINAHIDPTFKGKVNIVSYQSSWNTPNVYIPLYDDNGNPMIANGVQVFNHNRNNPNSLATVNNYDGRVIAFLSKGLYLDMPWGNPSATEIPTLQWVWNGKSYRSGTTIDGQFEYHDTYLIHAGVRYNRYTAGDEGSQSSGETDTVYSSKSILKVDDIVYDSTLTTEKGTVEFVDGTNYTINGRIYTPDSSLTDYGTNAEYYKIVPSLVAYYDTNGTLETLKAKLYYPTETKADTEKVLTDSKWDESTWVNTGQITKRFPIDRQYFQTLQLEFCGEADNQGIELYGFEVDGIQLTEVPY